MQLADNEIHVIAAPLDSEIPQHYYDILNAEERERAHRLIAPEHSHRFIMTHAILRILLGMYLQAEPSSLSFNFNKHRKPSMAPPYAGKLQFNLSHSADLAVFAFKLIGELGVDIERITADTKADVAARFFSATEHTALAALPPAEQAAGFYRVWARKEAIIKASGKGLAQPLASFSVAVDNSQQQVHADEQDWIIYPLAIHPLFAGALAVTHPADNLKIWDFIDQKPALRSAIVLSR